MRRRVALPLTLLLLLLPALPVGAEEVYHGRSPLQGSWPLSPQLYWAVRYEEAGTTDCVEHVCSVQGSVAGADRIRVRILGEGAVYAFLQDNVAERTVATLSCDETCDKEIPVLTRSDVTLWVVHTRGAANTLIEIDVSQALQTAMGDF